MDVQLIECPRDAMQGLHGIIPTGLKVQYLNALLRVGFHTLDFGSFVSPKAVPQLADTAAVLADLEPSDTHLLAIIANVRGAEAALQQDRIRFLGYPFSLSETFQQRNTNRSREQAFADVQTIAALTRTAERELVVYLSMGFGNPYGDAWSPELLTEWAQRMADLGIPIVSLADTTAEAEPADVEAAFRTLIPACPAVTFGAHFHATPTSWRSKIAAAWAGGCRRFDGALGGYGGCPFAKDELTGNVATEWLIDYVGAQAAVPALDALALRQAQALLPDVFVRTQ